MREKIIPRNFSCCRTLWACFIYPKSRWPLTLRISCWFAKKCLISQRVRALSQVENSACKRCIWEWHAGSHLPLPNRGERQTHSMPDICSHFSPNKIDRRTNMNTYPVDLIKRTPHITHKCWPFNRFAHLSVELIFGIECIYGQRGWKGAVAIYELKTHFSSLCHNMGFSLLYNPWMQRRKRFILR